MSETSRNFFLEVLVITLAAHRHQMDSIRLRQCSMFPNLSSHMGGKGSGKTVSIYIC